MSSEPVEGYGLSPQQRRLWRLQQATARRPFRAQCEVLIEGALDARMLEEAAREVVARHDILRTSLRRRAGMATPLQVVAAGTDVTVAAGDPGASGAADEERLRDSLWREFGERPFDEEQLPALRLVLQRLGERRHALLVGLPAFCADEVTLDNILDDLARAYVGGDQEGVDGDEPLQYAVFAEWQNELLETDDAADGREFWRSKGLPPVAALPFARREKGDDFTPRSVVVRVEGRTAERLAALAEESGAGEDVVLLTCWLTLLGRLTAQPEVAVALGCDGRSDEELARALGLFVRYVPVGARPEPHARFDELLAAVAESARDAREWQDCFTWDLLTGEEAAYLSYAFDYAVTPPARLAGSLSFTTTRRYACAERSDMRLSCRRDGVALTAEFQYDADVFEASDVERLARQYVMLLEAALASPRSPIGALDMLDETERRLVVEEFNDTRSAFDVDKRLHRLVEAQAARTPAATAVVFEGVELTYAELNASANRLARRLRREGVGPDALVGVVLERSAEMVVGLLAVLKAGGAYVPIDPGYPAERVGLIIADARPALLLTQERLANSLGEHGLPVVVLDAEPSPFADESAENLPGGATEDNLAYVIYTSGSTGHPKGVMIAHRAIANRLLWMQSAFPVGAGDRLLQKTTISFDASVWELFVPLLAGATLVVARPGGHQDPAYLVEAVERHGITVLQLVPSMLRLFLAESGVERCRSLKRMFCGGEALPGQLVAQFYALLGDAELHNLYGPTEVSIDATTYACAPGLADDVAPIGRPLTNVRVYLLDEYGRPVGIGQPGEVYVGGEGLARGYLARPALTAEKFLPDPFSGEPGARLYRTGDLGRFRPDGVVEFLGRADHQVKLRGFRIELGEVEAALRHHPAVRDAVAVVREDEPGNQRLVAYVVADEVETPARRDDRQLYRLPNGLEVAHLNKNETDILYKEIFEDEEYLLHGITLADGDCVFDVGANIGLFTLFVHTKCRRARIFSFEPSPPTFDALRSNVELHGIDAKPYQCAVSDHAGSAQFTFYPKVSASSGLYADAAQDAGVTRAFIGNQGELGRYADELLEGRFESVTYTCQLRTLSDVIREQGVERIDLLKVDVEKSEEDVLRGINEEDWRKIAQVVLEVHDTGGRLQAVTSLLEAHGFRLHVDQYLAFENTGLYNVYAIHPARAARPGRAAAGANGDGRPAAHTTAAVQASAQGLRQFLGESLPDYMVPSSVVLLDKLPLLPNGKVNRQALPAPPAEAGVEADAAPLTPLEELVTNIWAQVLGRERVGVRDNFFDLGGHSLLATQVVTRLREYLRSEVPLHAVFEAANAADLARRLEALLAAQAGVETPPLVPVPRPEGRAPVSFAQQRLWFLDRLEPGTTYFNVPAIFRLRGALDAALLEQTINEVVRRHEALRTSFVEERGEPVQVIAPSSDVPLRVVELADVPAPSREARARELAAEEAARPFDLATGPLLRALLLRLAEDEHIAVLTLHHIVADGWSMGVLVKEAMALYEALGRGEASPLEPLPIQYADFAVWQRGWLKGEALEKLAGYWRRQLAGAPPALELPTDRPLPTAHTYRGSRLAFAVPAPVASGLKALARREGATLFMTLLAGFDTLLRRYTGQEDIVVGTDIANRNRLETEGLVGFFINQLALRTDLSGDPTFRELLARVRAATLGAYAHQDLPFDKLVDELKPERDPRRPPVFQVKLVLQNAPFQSLELPGLTLSPVELEATQAHLPLTFFMRETDEGLSGVLEYNTDLFDAATAEGLASDFALVLARAAAEPGARLSELAALVEVAAGERLKVGREKLAASSFQKFKGVKPKAVQSSAGELVAEQPSTGGRALPLIFEPRADGLDLADWASHNRALVNERLARHGAVLFRGFPLRPERDFARVTRALCDDLFIENGEHPRRSLGDHVYTPVFYPPEEMLLWHNENSFNHRWPMKLWFCCERPADRGGETPLADSREVFRRLDPRLRERFLSRGVMYVRNYGGGLGLTWQEVFQTDDPAEAERRCREAGMELEWGPEGRARTRCVRPAAVRHPLTGEPTWFNQAQHWHVSCLDPRTRDSIAAVFRVEDYPRHCYYGDGSPIEDSAMEEILGVYRAAEVVTPWRAGDILMVDNLLTAHARRPFEGERRLLVAMGEMGSYDEVTAVPLGAGA
jgi:amino acid adenylation domain-containing protein/FkbM family methyltransferase